MKRLFIALGMVLFLLLALLILTHRDGTDANAPRYHTIQTQPPGPFTSENYGWGDGVPIRDGRFWLWTVYRRTNSPLHISDYYYDLNEHRVIGELLNGSPIFANQDQTKLLCEGYGPPQYSLKQRLGMMVSRFSGGRLTLFPSNRVEAFWVLDLRSNSAVRLGQLSQYPGTGSRWSPAPGFRFGFNEPSTSSWGQEFFLCDLEKNTMEKIRLIGDLRGWWDDHRLVFEDAADNYWLFDVVTRESTPLFAKADLSNFLRSQGITEIPTNYATLFSRNGPGMDMFISADRRDGLDTNSTFLVKVRHDGPRFEMTYRNFQFRWLGHLDESGTHYLYSGESGAPGSGGNGGVYLRDLSDGSERVIVPPDNSGQYALARLYSNTVIYSRRRALWQVDLDTTNASPLFPAPGN